MLERYSVTVTESHIRFPTPSVLFSSPFTVVRTPSASLAMIRLLLCAQVTDFIFTTYSTVTSGNKNPQAASSRLFIADPVAGSFLGLVFPPLLHCRHIALFGEWFRPHVRQF